MSTVSIPHFGGLRTDTDQLSMPPGESPNMQNVSLNKVGSLKTRAGLTKVGHDDPSVHVLTTDQGTVAAAWGKCQADGAIRSMTLFNRSKVPTRPAAPTNTTPENHSTNTSINPTLTITPGNPNGTYIRWSVSSGINASTQTLTGIVWTTPWLVYAPSIVVNSTNGTFEGDLEGEDGLDYQTSYFWWATVKDDDDGESDPSDPTDTETEEEEEEEPVVVTGPCSGCESPASTIAVVIPEAYPNAGTWMCDREENNPEGMCVWYAAGPPAMYVTASPVTQPGVTIYYHVAIDAAGYNVYAADCSSTAEDLYGENPGVEVRV